MMTVRRLGSIVLNTATALSLFLCLATIALWLRSYWTADLLTYRGPTANNLFLGVSRGKIAFSSGSSYAAAPAAAPPAAPALPPLAQSSSKQVVASRFQIFFRFPLTFR